MHSSGAVDCSPEGARRTRSPRAGRGVHTQNGMPAAAVAEPRSVSELQLYWVLQQANLLSYYHIFISQGGDDVQQLCEAGEVEFLEIMALVGMASKPLHVRRLQKALREWASGPGVYARAAAVSTTSVSRLPGFCGRGLPATAPAGSPAPPCTVQELKQERELPGDSTHTAATTEIEGPPHWDVSRLEETPKWDRQTPPMELPAPDRDEVRGSVAGAPSPPPASTPTLSEGQVGRLAAVAAQLARALPRLPPRTHHNGKKKACAQQQAQELMRLPADEPSRLERYRQHAAIYGRFDAKRSAERPLSLHEVFVNEAAAHICLHVPALLSRRDDLFPLARQVVRLAGFQYSKGHSRSQASQSTLAVPPLYREEAAGGESEFAPTSPDRNQHQGSPLPIADGKRLRFCSESCPDGSHGGDRATCSDPSRWTATAGSLLLNRNEISR